MVAMALAVARDEAPEEALEVSCAVRFLFAVVFYKCYPLFVIGSIEYHLYLLD